MAIVSTVFGLAEEVIYPRLSDHLRVAVKKRGGAGRLPGVKGGKQNKMHLPLLKTELTTNERQALLRSKG